jgi:hypothetical protein
MVECRSITLVTLKAISESRHRRFLQSPEGSGEVQMRLQHLEMNDRINSIHKRPQRLFEYLIVLVEWSNRREQ